MADNWLDDSDSEAIDLFGGEEGAEDYLEDWDEEAETYDDEAVSPAVRRRRAQARQLAARRRRLEALARARNKRARGARGPTPAGRKAVQQTQSAVRELSLDTKVQADAMKNALQKHSDRTSRSEYSTLASVALSQFQQSFPQIVGTSRYTAAALNVAPLLLLSPQKKGSGALAIARDPRALGLLLVAGLAVAGDRLRPKQVARIDVPNVPTVVARQRAALTADALDEKGKRIDGTVFTWTSSNPAVATLYPSSGPTTTVTGVSAGETEITVTAGSVQRQIPLKVDSVVRQIEISGASKVAVNSDATFIADALDDKGRSIDAVVFDWDSSDKNIATVDPVTGKVKGQNPGTAVIVAKSNGVLRRKTIEVE